MPRSLLTAMDNSSGDSRMVPVAADGTLLVDHDADRLTLVISSDGTADISISTEPGQAHPNGIIIAAKASPIVMSRELWGGLVKKRWFCSRSAGTAQVCVAVARDTHTPQLDKQ